MRASISRTGAITITGEFPVEVYALRKWSKQIKEIPGEDCIELPKGSLIIADTVPEAVDKPGN